MGQLFDRAKEAAQQDLKEAGAHDKLMFIQELLVSLGAEEGEIQGINEIYDAIMDRTAVEHSEPEGYGE